MAKNKQVKNGKLEIGNSLSIFDAAMLHEKIIEVYKNSDVVEIDLKDITNCDTAGIQLLYSLKKSSLNDGKELNILNPSSAVEDTLNRMSISLNTFI